MGLAVGLVPVVLLLSTNSSGVGITYDSTEYFAGAKSLVENGAFNAVDGRPQSTWPPGYSFLISVPHRVGLSLEASSLVVSALALMVIVISVLQMLLVFEVSGIKSMAVVALVMISPGLIEASSVALSELPFIAALLASFALLVSQQRAKFVFVSGIFIGSACLVRYVGIFFIPFVAALTFVCQRRVASKLSAAVRTTVLLIAAMAIPAIWMRRNIRLTGSATGNREPGGGTFIDATEAALKALGQLLIGARVSPGIQFAIGVILTVALLVAAGLAVSHRRLEILLITSIPVAYLFFTAYRFVHVEYAPIDLRAMTPTAPFLVIALASASWPEATRIRPPKWAAWSAVSLLLLLGVVDIGAKTTEAEAWGSDKFQNSNFAKVVAELPEDSVIISNFPQRAFSLTQSLPIRNQYQFDLPPIKDCSNRFGLWFVEAPFQGNEPALASVIYADDQGRIFDLGDCSIPVKSFWE